jgi:hypothetical protein
MNHFASSPARCRRLSRVAVAVCLTASSLATAVAASQAPASATVTPVAGCSGSWDFDLGIYFTYARNNGSSGSLGCPTSNTFGVPNGKGIGMHFQRGSIYWKNSVSGTSPEVLLDPVRLKWGLLGWENSVLGWPLIDTFPILGPNNELGLIQEFEGGTIFSSSAGTFEVHGAIRQKFVELGGVGALGFPTTDEQEFPQSGRSSSFSKGTGTTLYWFPDPNLPVLQIKGQIQVNYTGLICIREMDEDQATDSDEPYVTIGTVAPHWSAGAVQSTVYQDVDSGEGRPDNKLLYRGKPEGLDLAIVLMEEDDGQSGSVRAAVDGGLRAAAGALTTAIAGIPVVGSAIAVVAAPVLQAVVPTVTKAVSGLFGLDDDVIGQQTRTFTAKDMVVLANFPQLLTTNGVTYQFVAGPYTADSSDYRLGLRFTQTG